jgi:hypothetical protein
LVRVKQDGQEGIFVNSSCLWIVYMA